MELGVFSVSLNVSDLMVSKKFYEKLGFSVFGGDIESNYLIMKNKQTLIGLFQGMFEHNILTFNPGWDVDAKILDSFEDIRQIQEGLLEEGVHIEAKIAEGTSGAANLIIIDPDGNPILIDQHV
tara:strand:+ start:29402 stop:29773 length:372 start_codon:yes stop_codon:yes gene_type:complete